MRCRAGDWSAAAAAYQVLLALNPPDPVAAHCGLAQAWMALAGSRRPGRRSSALEIAPTFQPAQQLLLELNAWRVAGPPPLGAGVWFLVQFPVDGHLKGSNQ